MKRIKSLVKNSILILLSAFLLAFLVFANRAGTITQAEEDGFTVITETSDGDGTVVSTSVLDEAGSDIQDSQGGTSVIGENESTEITKTVSDSSGWITSYDDNEVPDINVTGPSSSNSNTSSGSTNSYKPSFQSLDSAPVSGSTDIGASSPKAASYPDGTVAVISYNYNGEDVDDTYITLAEALADVANIAEKVHASGNASFVPTIKLQDDLTLTFNMSMGESTSFSIDFNGHRIAVDAGILLDFGGSNVTFKDSTASTIYLDGITDNTKPGGIQGESGTLVASTGILKFSSGFYRITSGTIARNANEVIVNDAFLCSPGGRIVENVSTLTVNGGFFTYDSEPCDDDCNLAVINSGSLGDVTILLNGSSIDGYAVSNAVFLLTMHQFGDESSSNPTYSYATFEQAFTKAAQLSSDNEGTLVSIRLVDTSITAVSLSKTYTLSKEIGGVGPLVQLENINITRGSRQDEALFIVKDGALILRNCTVNGQLSDSVKSQGSMILVENGAALKLSGTADKGTKITKNTALVGMISGDPCSGIWVKDGGKIELAGNIVVNNNIAYTDSESATISEDTSDDGNNASSNICLDPTAKLIISGQILTRDGYQIGINHGDSLVVDGQVIGSLTDSFATEVANGDEDTLVLTSFFMDDKANFTLTYDENNHTLYWDQTSGSLLPEAGVLRIEYLILLIGLIGFIFRNVKWIKGNPEAERYVTVLATICLVLGAAIGFYHLRSEQMLVARNQEIVEAITAETERTAAEAPAVEATSAALSADEAVEEIQTENPAVPDDGREYIGIIEIESLGITLPVLSTYTDADMKTTPCVYYGCVESDNLVIVGHNYDSQFGDFNKLGSADSVEVKLTLVDGTTYIYQSKLIENLNPDQTDEMLQGQWDLTLFTCSYSGEKRITIRCDLKG